MTFFRRSVVPWLQKYALFPFLFPIFFVLHVAHYYEAALPLWDVLIALAAYLSLALVFSGFLKLIFKRRIAWSLATFLFLAFWIYWANLILYAQKIIKSNGSYSYDLSFAIASFFLIVLLSTLSRKFSVRTVRNIIYYLNTLFIIFILVELFFLGGNVIADLSRPPEMLQQKQDLLATRNMKPGNSIYLLLFDEYASPLSLKQDWGIDNSKMDSFLKSRGFYVNETSRSNYNETVFSMPSLLCMNYFRGYQKPFNYYRDLDVAKAKNVIRNSIVPKLLQQAGYRLSIHSIFDVAGKKGIEIPNIVLSKSPLFKNSFYDACKNGYLPYFLERSRIKQDPRYRYSVFYEMDDYNNEGIQMVMEEARRHNGPAFVYAHFMMPHNRYFYDSSGQLMPMDTIKAITPNQDLRYYRYAIRHVNLKMREMIDSIQQHDPNACIIALGDHGYRKPHDGKIHPEYFRNLSAVYFPDQDYHSLPAGFTNVNLFRLVLNKVCGTDFSLITPRYFMMESQH